ncbi:S8 family peptidase [Roseobacter sp. CCS2]|uniref:S8 family peptidase n=1 Tax=Roseobacter sp. CCS2 TaxID=391593 RepID=UPI0000F3FCCD|nr:S8 family peptidase [Roseobacter sp. CCS2]EBA10915.1 extracellular alkaline serine protease [Roseobacter sp. CCS2]
MATKRTPRLVLMEDDLNVADAGMEQVSSVRKGLNAVDSVSTLIGVSEIASDSALISDEINTLTVDLTDKEVKELADKPGVTTIEDDVWNEAYTDDSLGDIVDEDPEASAEIDDAQAEIEEADGQMSDEDISARAADAITTEFTGPEIDFDEEGQAFALSASTDPIVMDTADAAGIDRDKLFKFIRCVVKCAMSELGGDKANAEAVDDAMVSRIMAEQGVASDNVSAQAIRDYITCGLKIIYARYAWRYSTGAGVRVAIVDTGIAPRHPDLRVYGGASFVPGVRSWADDQGHGTHVAGTVAGLANNRGVVGVAPHARLYAVKVLNSRGSGRLSWIINGLIWCYRTNMHVANLSLGSRANTHNPRVYSAAYERAGRLLRRKGILAVAAAGNSNGPVGNPARCPSFMAVSAVDCNRRRAGFSCYGPQVEMAAPGVGVVSTYPQSGYRSLNGTSMASPHVAGVAALIKRRHPSWSGDRIRVHMWRTATDIGARGRDIAYGYGLVNAYRAVR